MITAALDGIPVAPEGPGLPFGSVELIVYDSLRVLILVLGLVNLLLKPWLIRRCRTPGQAARILGLGMLAVVGMSVELEHLGDYANWRLYFVLVAMVINTWGNYSMLRYETPSTIRSDQQRIEQRNLRMLRRVQKERDQFRASLL